VADAMCPCSDPLGLFYHRSGIWTNAVRRPQNSDVVRTCGSRETSEF
jgi:hypothetical protein